MPEKDYLQLPLLLKHVTTAIFNKLSGTQETRIVNAFNIARGKLVQSGYLSPGSVEGPPTAISLTPTGVDRNRIHEKESKLKSSLFDSMVWILEQSYIAEQTVGQKPPSTTPAQVMDVAIQLEKLAATKKPIQRVPNHNPPPGSRKSKSRANRAKSASAEKAKRATAKRARKA